MDDHLGRDIRHDDLYEKLAPTTHCEINKKTQSHSPPLSSFLGVDGFVLGLFYSLNNVEVAGENRSQMGAPGDELPNFNRLLKAMFIEFLDETLAKPCLKLEFNSDSLGFSPPLGQS